MGALWMKPKQLCIFLLILVMMLFLRACSKTRVKDNTTVTLVFIYEEENINVTLTNDESAKVIDILHGNPYDPTILFGFPSCGFHENVALQVGNRRFAIASDTCNCIQDLDNGSYFDIPKEDMAYIHSLFEKYGGYFPCI